MTRRRAIAIWTGGALWIAYPIAMWIGMDVRHRARCGPDRVGQRGFEECFTDYLPVLEIAWSVIVWVLGIAFVAAARRAWDPGVRAAQRPRWEVLLLIGFGWTVWNVATLPWNAAGAPLVAYWLAFAGWFVVTFVFGRRGA